MYRNLDPDKTISTLERLNRRINERFPDAGLGKVCHELQQIAEDARAKAEWIARPYYGLRIAIGAVILLSILVLVYSILEMDIAFQSLHAGELVQIIEATVNDLIFIGAAIFFLVTVETRIKRSRALSALHELRTVAHVIDMHQLTKDPGQLDHHIVVTPSSPKRELNAYELTRYLDYCSEMLSLTGKTAALYAQTLPDAVVLSTVNEVESLTTSLSRKIWQKIMILQRLDESLEKDGTKPTGNSATG